MLNQVFGLAISFSLINSNVGANINLEAPTISLYPQEYQQVLVQRQTIHNYQVESSYMTSQSNPAFKKIKQQEEQRTKQEDKKRRQREEKRKKQIAKQKKARLKKLQAQSSQKKS